MYNQFHKLGLKH